MHTIKSSSHISNTQEQKNYISHILTPIYSGNGYVFGLVRFLGKPGQTHIMISEAIEERLKRFNETINDEVNIARRFEQLLQALNEDIEQIIINERQFPISDAQIIIGVIHQNQVFISGTGNLNALFMHRSAKQRYVIYELSEQLKDNGELSWKKLFSTILDGELHPGDIFYIATKVSAREITQGELQDILTTLPASGSLKRISQFLNSDTVYGAICFQVADEPIIGAPKKVNPVHSMNQLDKTKKDTAHILGEETPDIAGFISKITSPIIKKLSAPGTRGYKSLAKRITKLILQLVTFILLGLIKLLVLIWKYTVIGIKNLPGIIRTGSELIKEQPSPKERVNKTINWFNSLPNITKYGGLALIVIISILTSTILLVHRSAVKEEEQRTFNTVVSNIEEKVSASQASLIYDDSAQAKIHLQEALTLLQTLSSDSSSQEDKIDELDAKLQQLSYDIQKITPVDLSTLAENKDLNLTIGVQIQDTIYAISGKNIYRLNELEGQWQEAATQSGAIGNITKVSSTDSNEFLFIDELQQLGRGDMSSLTMNPIVSGVSDMESISDLQWYNGNLYVLTASGNQIVKMRPQGNGYEAGTPWITSTLSGTTLSSARALAIDGNIYVLSGSKINSFLSGREQTFETDDISPIMDNATDITATDDNEYIYILEPDEKRVIVFDKQGKLVAQYINDELANALSIFVRETSIIVLTKTGAFSFAANHLLK